MSTIIVASIVVGGVAGICWLLIFIANRQKTKKINRRLHRFSELGTSHQLSFSSQEVLNNNIVGLDGINRKLLVLTQVGERLFDEYVVDLREVKNCTVKRSFGNSTPVDSRSRRAETHIEKLSLQFEFYGDADPFEIVFYNHIDNNIYHLADLEEKANHWQQILTKMLNRRLQKIG